ncbi:hypothetical protein H206_02794 [Candidatus Electrothrix aarhusensis]|uniref:DUF4434 domain-containing protein n=1 Tax=Candidatus Electrothrix aarhusensis TaxID=1859131 RepID=A0A3S3QT83_9BACT|nr:hypothetical protein H206_02794 [Candidatus Electrothrix aarhusensis]
MADTGAKMLFYQWVTHYEKTPTWFMEAYGGGPEADFAFYNPAPVTINGIPTQGWVTPTEWPGSPKKSGKEPVDYLLDAAQKAGIKVWLGLYLNEGESSPYNWWNAITDSNLTTEDRAAIDHHVERSIAVVNDLAAQYGDHPALGGLYYSIEIANNAFIPQDNYSYLASILDQVAKAVHTALPGKQLAICPFFNTTLSTAEEFGTMLEYALQHSELDILMLQDGVGVEPHTLTPINDQVTKYFVAARNAADAAGKPFWGNAELFTNLGTRETPQLISSTMDKIRLQLETIAPHVDKIISFDFHFMDPNDAYTFYPLLGNGTAAADSTMRQNLYDGYTPTGRNGKNSRGGQPCQLFSVCC